MNLRNKSFLLLTLLLLFACGGGETLDSQGLASSDSAFEQFTRASQLYYRGRLTAALDEFNGVIYRFPNSPLASDARLAVRRVESDLSGEVAMAEFPNEAGITASIAVVGKPSVSSSIHQASSSLRLLGPGVTEIIDAEAPELTVVFYCQGYDEAALTVADSLGKWLSHPENIAHRPGEELIAAVAEGYDVLVIVGSDAVFTQSMP